MCLFFTLRKYTARTITKLNIINTVTKVMHTPATTPPVNPALCLGLGLVTCVQKRKLALFAEQVATVDQNLSTTVLFLPA